MMVVMTAPMVAILRVCFVGVLYAQALLSHKPVSHPIMGNTKHIKATFMYVKSSCVFTIDTQEY
ncbi:hypothetical protein JCM18909_3740 [Cutibacterium acnes JCM 18909]|nr:hypothetical protein JCM18909_3740 [Cutibacterium acnes JCM 18909]